MEFLSQPDLMLYKFVCNIVRAHGRKNRVFNQFLFGGKVRDAVCFFGKLYYLLMMSEYTNYLVP